MHKVFLMADANTLFRAIAHPARRQILTLLANSDRSVKELTAAFTMSQPAVSQHLRELRQARLVTSRKVGSEQKYKLTAAPLKTVFEWCSQYRRFFDPAGHAWAFSSATQGAARMRKGGD
jgi:DNA-binding transcriptional ArsR family regulator